MNKDFLNWWETIPIIPIGDVSDERELAWKAWKKATAIERAKKKVVYVTNDLAKFLKIKEE